MIERSSLGTQRPPPPQRVPSGGSLRAFNRPNLPSKLSNVNVPTQHDAFVDLTEDDRRAEGSKQFQPGVIDLEEEDPKLPTLVLDQPSHEQDGGRHNTHDQMEDTKSVQEALPMPGRPPFLDRKASQRHRIALTMAQRGTRDPSRRAYDVKPPTMATMLPSRKAADFFPWTGKHPEDTLNEQIVKQGYSDKPLVPSQSESNFARPILWPVLKNKSGLHMLGVLFAQILDKRQQRGRCTAQSTFKPPPRVTLTDSKREAWLRDLKNPQVPLRRLSRTIPHGIRGKVLLEQCIGKEIPIPRALWLVKCVGANEIRAFKRKGVSGSAALSGELKWLREWTVFVEQFVESTMDACGEPDWQAKMNYTTRFATHLFSENLVDSDHYSNWLLDSFESSSIERLPVWLLMIQIYWKHLISRRSYARQLARSILQQLSRLRKADTQQSTIVNIGLRLQKLITVLAVQNRGCLVNPGTWNEFKHVFSSNTFSQQPELRPILASIERRNQLVSGPADSTPSGSRSPKLRFIEALDAAGAETQVESMASQASQLLPDPQIRVDRLLEWTASKHREGISRIYLAARILKRWKDNGLDTDEAVLTTLAAMHEREAFDSSMVHRTVAELARTGDFSIGRFLQWLISMGILYAAQDSSSNAQLMLEIPINVDGISTTVLNLRRTLLLRLGLAPNHEAEQLQTTKNMLTQLLIDAENNSAALYSPNITPLSQLQGSVRLGIGQWLCTESIRSATGGVEAGQHGSSFFVQSIPRFCLVRNLLESLQDFTSLARFVRAAIASDDAGILACVTDTIRMHSEIFAAMGVLRDLTDRLCQRQRTLRAQQPLDGTFLRALSALLQDFPFDPTFGQALANDVAVFEQQHSAMACSPASDNMITQQPGSLDSDDDIDRVLASGNSMDEQLLARMFSVIVQRAARVGSSSSPGIVKPAQWFATLRIFDQTTFDQLARDLMGKLASAGSDAATLDAITSALVSSGSTGLRTLYQAFEHQILSIKATNQASAGRTAHTCLKILLSPTTVDYAMLAPEIYRYRLEKALYIRRHPEDILQLVQIVMDCASGTNTPEFLREESVLAVLRRYAVVAPSELQKELGLDRSHPARHTAQLEGLLGDMLYGTASDGLVKGQLAESIRSVLSSATDLSLPFCRLALQYLVSPRSHTFDDDQSGHAAHDALVQSLQDAIDQDQAVWPQLLSYLGEDVAHSIRLWAQHRVLDAASAFIATPGGAPDRAGVGRYLEVTEVACASSALKQAADLTTLTDKLHTFQEYMSQIDILATSHPSPDDSFDISHLCFWVSTLHRLAVIYQRSSPDLAASSAGLNSFLGVSCSLLLHPKLQMQSQTLQLLFDVICVLSDDLTHDTTVSLSQQFSASQRADPRMKFIFGPAAGPEGRLALASRVHPPLPQSSAAAGNAPSPTSSMGHKLPPRPPPPTSGFPGRPQSLQQPQAAAQTGSPQVRQQPMSPAAARAAQGPWGPEIKYTPFPLRRWEIMPDPTPNMGENDTSLSLGLFNARRAPA